VTTVQEQAGEAAPDSARMRDALQCYLDGKMPGLGVAECERISGGFETFIYGVRLEQNPEAGGEPPLPCGPTLILRVYRGPSVVERSSWETAAIRRVRQAAIPAPELYLYEPDPEPLGGSFLMLAFLPGRRLDEAATSAGPIAVLRMIRNFAKTQASIYALDWPEGRAMQEGTRASEVGPISWAQDRLDGARADLEARGIHALLPVVDWLQQRRALMDPADDVFVHGDFHPLNVFVEGAAICGILDWGGCGFANKHEDIGWTGMLIATATSADPKEDRKLAPFRKVAYRIYQAAIWQACRLNRKQLRYGEVYAALRWMLIFLPSYLPNAGEPVLNDDAIAFTTSLYVKRVRGFIEKRTKLKLAIE
jgi:aminoglycoside phosphotransferase (APT) family kinase protein